MAHKIPTQAALKMEDLFTRKMSEDQLEALLRKLFRSKEQIKYILQFIKVLYNYICTHSQNAEITIEQQWSNNSHSSYFLPGEFEIVINNLGAKIEIDAFPLPESFDGIAFSHRAVCFIDGRSQMKYILRLAETPRQSVSVKPKLPERDRSPVRSPSSSSDESSSEEKKKKKKKAGFFSALFP
jgi:hypothetical protein